MARLDLEAVRVRIPLLVGVAAVLIPAAGLLVSAWFYARRFAGARRAGLAWLTAFEQVLLPLSLGLAFTALVALLLDRWLREPAQRIETAARRLAAGDLEARTGLTGGSELDQVGRALDHMADALARAQQESNYSRRRLEQVLHALPAALILTDRDSGRVLLVSARWSASSLGRIAVGDDFHAHVSGERFFRMDGSPLAPEDLATTRTLRTGRPAVLEEFVAVHSDGRRAHHSAWAIPLSLGGERDFDAVLTVVQDRDEVFALAGRLREWEERFRKVADATGQVVYEWDFASGAVRRTGNQQPVLGFTAEEERALDALEHWRSRVHPDDREATTAAFERHRIEGTPFDLEYRYRRDERRWIRIHDRGFFERDEAGHVVRMIGSMSDVTAQRETEAQLRQAQKMETVGTLAGGVAHDFNNQLTGVLGHLDMLADALGPQDPRQEHVRIAQAAAERCADLTRGLLAFSRRLHGNPVPGALGCTVEESVRLLRRVLPANIRVDTALDPALPPVRFDATQIQQVLFNLCINARDAMPHGGVLTLSTGAGQRPSGAPGSPDAAPGAWAWLRVADDGAGIPADVLPRVFEPFFTTKPVGSGTGLGLAMVYGIVREHGGWIEAASTEGEGSAFTVWLPFATEGEGAAPRDHFPAVRTPPRAGAEGVGGGALVLVVDDEAVLRQLACRALRDNGYRVLEAVDAAAGLELASAHAEELRGVLLDLTMPGMSGAQALPLLREIAPRAAVVLTSGYSAESARAIEGAAAFLAKPWSPAELSVTLRRAIDENG